MTEQTKSKPKRRYARVVTTLTGTEPVAPAEKATAPPRTTKISQVIALLERKQGATLDEMVKATGWLPHTTRAALTGLKKKGHTVERDKRGDETCYRIARNA